MYIERHNIVTFIAYFMIYSYILFLTIYIYHVSEKSSLLITPYNFGDEGVYFKNLNGGDKSEDASFVRKI